MIPEMQREPRAAHRPHAGSRLVDRHRVTPEIGVVVNDEATRAVQGAGDAAAVLLGAIDQVEERLVQFGEVADLRRPVVHLDVDVDGVLALPRRRQRVVPDSLKVRRHRSRTAARNEQVARELEVDRLELRIRFASRDRRETFVGGNRARATEVERDAVEQAIVIGDVRVAQARVSPRRRCRRGIGSSTNRVRAAHVCRRGQNEGDRLGIPD